MSAEWFIAKNRQQAGPFTSNDLRKMVTSGQLHHDDLVWKDGMADWVPASKIKGLFATAPPLPQPAIVQSPPPSAPSAKSMMPAFSKCWSMIQAGGIGAYGRWRRLGIKTKIFCIAVAIVFTFNVIYEKPEFEGDDYWRTNKLITASEYRAERRAKGDTDGEINEDVKDRRRRNAEAQAFMEQAKRDTESEMEKMRRPGGVKDFLGKWQKQVNENPRLKRNLEDVLRKQQEEELKKLGPNHHLNMGDVLKPEGPNTQ